MCTRLKIRTCISSPVEEIVLRPSQHHFNLIKANITDGCTSTTSLFDKEVGDPPLFFRQGVTNFEIAQAILDEGYESEAQKIASDGLEK